MVEEGTVHVLRAGISSALLRYATARPASRDLCSRPAMLAVLVSSTATTSLAQKQDSKTVS